MRVLIGSLIAVILFGFGTSMAAEVSSGKKSLGELLGEAMEDINFQDFKQAESKLRIVLEAEPDNPYARYYLGSLLYQTGRFSEAIPHLEFVVHSSTRFEGDEELLAATYVAAGFPEKALPIYKKMTKVGPAPENIVFQYAIALEKAGKRDLAESYYENLIARNGQYKDAARFQLGAMRVQAGAYRSAAEYFRKVDPGSAYGKSAKEYLDSLEPSLQPVSVYLSAEYFYNTNPGSATSTYAKGAVPQAAAEASTGETLVASLTTTSWEMTEALQARLNYTYFGTFFSKKSAKSNEFTANHVTPSLTYIFSPQWQLEGSLEYQLATLGGYRLSSSYGWTLKLNCFSRDRKLSAYLDANYLIKRYNQSYGDPATPVDMQYLDANSPTIGGGGSITYSDYNAVLGLDYKLLYERTLRNTNAVLNEKANDSVYREHTVTLTHNLPFAGVLEGLSLDVTLGYSYRSYRSPQTGTSLPSIKPGNYLTVRTGRASGKVQYLISKKYNLNLAVGGDWANAQSHATELTYQQSRYFGVLSASF